MWVVGLTGSIGMGKSAVSDMLRGLGVPVSDADAIVHAIYAKGGAAVEPLSREFPGVVIDGAVSRPALSKAVLGDAAALKRLEALVHPLVRAARRDFLARARAAAEPLAVLDIPLLYEAGCEKECDEVLVVSAPPSVQRERVLSRPNMRAMAPEESAAKFEAILANQLPDAEKRKRAHCVIDTGAPMESTRAAVAAFAEQRRPLGAQRRRRRRLAAAAAAAAAVAVLVAAVAGRHR